MRNGRRAVTGIAVGIVLLLGYQAGEAMKGDFSRFTHDPMKRYSGVYQQQGRVILDSDWNEEVAIETTQRRTRTLDTVGASGVPAEGGGFAIAADADGGLTISAGRMYVDGILCRVEEPVRYDSQPDVPEPPPLEPEEGRLDLIYVDVWERHITAIEDPALLEPALGGPDTATRVKTISQVRALAGAEDLSPLEETLGQSSISTTGGYPGLENQLYRVEIHAPGTGRGEASFKWSRDNGSIACPVGEVVARNPNLVVLSGDCALGEFRTGDLVEVLGDQTELKQAPGIVARIVDVDPTTPSLLLDTDVSSVSGETHPKVRRWDGIEPITEGQWLELEDGVAIRFTPGGRYRSGDYWQFAARAATGAVEELNEEPPHGIDHHYAPLAVVTWVRRGDRLVPQIEDRRAIFRTLTEVEAELRALREFRDEVLRWIEEAGPPDAQPEARDTAFLTGERVYGKYRGTVTDNSDPRSLGRLRAHVPEVLGDIETEWALPSVPCGPEGASQFTIPVVGAGVWIEFEAGDVSRPIWSGCWWDADQLAVGSSGEQTSPGLRVVRSEQGLTIRLDDGSQTIHVSDAEGRNLLEIQVQAGVVRLEAAMQAIIDAPEIELGENSTHPIVLGDNLLQYLTQLVAQFNAHVHPGQEADGVPVQPAPPVPALVPPSPALLSDCVTSR